MNHEHNKSTSYFRNAKPFQELESVNINLYMSIGHILNYDIYQVLQYGRILNNKKP